MVAVPLATFSITDCAAVLKLTVGVGSSSLMVSVCVEVVPRAALVGAVRVATTVSLASLRVSLLMLTVSCLLVSPGLKVIGLAGVSV